MGSILGDSGYPVYELSAFPQFLQAEDGTASLTCKTLPSHYSPI
jgi:hypothetical protein